MGVNFVNFAVYVKLIHKNQMVQGRYKTRNGTGTEMEPEWKFYYSCIFSYALEYSCCNFL